MMVGDQDTKTSWLLPVKRATGTDDDHSLLHLCSKIHELKLESINLSNWVDNAYSVTKHSLYKYTLYTLYTLYINIYYVY